MELFCGSVLHVKAISRFHRGAVLLMFDGVLNEMLSEEKVSTTGVKTKFELTPRSHFIEGGLIHLLVKSKNV